MKKCYICGSEESSTNYITECDRCGKNICLESESCCEQLNDGDSHICTECIKEMEKFDCNKCVVTEDECPFDRSYSYCYDCPEYVETLEDIRNKNGR